ncbi:hypothetical protein AGMMS50268_37220 [Spirochaetia bacterium]|nr:hypothetical protein AGMMS50268_37220 [Spirochaetia bacterium]
MKGWIYRRAMNLKDCGERIKPRFIGDIVRDIGLTVREWILGHTTVVTPHRGR